MLFSRRKAEKGDGSPPLAVRETGRRNARNRMERHGADCTGFSAKIPEFKAAAPNIPALFLRHARRFPGCAGRLPG